MADAKENEDVKFDVAELTSTDEETADKALEKRNSPAPESIRDELDKTSWPVTEGRKPAVMRADKESDHDYQLDTYKKVDKKARSRERTAGPGEEARAVATRELNKLAREGASVNDFQAPPSAPAQAAADGEGAEAVTTQDRTKTKRK